MSDTWLILFLIG